jgi:hypothetical protein
MVFRGRSWVFMGIRQNQGAVKEKTKEIADFSLKQLCSPHQGLGISGTKRQQ